MKLVPAVIGVVIAGVLGYVLEPLLRPMLVMKAPQEEVAAGDSAAEPAAGPDAGASDAFDAGPGGGEMADAPAETPAVEEPAEPSVEIPDWVAGLVPGQLPEKVSLKKIARVPLPGSPQPMELPAGAKVTPLRVEGTMLIISPFSGPIEGAVAIVDTDLLEQLGDTPPEPVVAEAAEATDAGEATEATEAGEAPVVGASAGDMAATEEPMGTFDDGSGEEVSVEAPAAGPLGLDAEGIVKVMQDSIGSGQIEEFSSDQVQEWEAGDVETVDGEEFQTGTASYRAETIFGVKTIQAKALIHGGKVVRWIWPKSGMEIK